MQPTKKEAKTQLIAKHQLLKKARLFVARTQSKKK
jgi:hypothetical protein